MAGRMLPLYLTMASLLTTLTLGENPAIKAILTNKGLQYVTEIGAELLQDTLDNASLPIVNGEVSLSILGTVYYTLTEMTVSKCDFEDPSMDFNEDVSGFKAAISGLNMEVTGSWSTSYGIIEDGGSFVLNVWDVAVASLVSLKMNAGGRPSIGCAGCIADVGSASIVFYGGGSWFFQIFVDFFEERIRSTIEEQICPLLQQRIDALGYQLEDMGVTLQVYQDLVVDVPLTSLPVINSSSLSLSLRGQFHSSKGDKEPPFEAQPFSFAGDVGHMLSLGLSEYTTNSAAYAYFTSGQLQAFITDNMIPPSSPFRLNTRSFGPFIPELPKMYPGMEMKLQVYAREAPDFHFKSGAIETDLLGAIKAFGVKADGALIPLFVLNAKSTFTGKFCMAAGKLTGSVAMDMFNLTQVSSEVGTIKIDALETFMKIAIHAGLSTVNAKLIKGIDLPKMQHVKLTNLIVKVEEGFISVLSDAIIWLMRDVNV